MFFSLSKIIWDKSNETLLSDDSSSFDTLFYEPNVILISALTSLNLTVSVTFLIQKSQQAFDRLLIFNSIERTRTHCTFSAVIMLIS